VHKLTKDSEVSFKLLGFRDVFREQLSGFLRTKKSLLPYLKKQFDVSYDGLKKIYEELVKIFEDSVSLMGNTQLKVADVLIWYFGELKESFSKELGILALALCDLYPRVSFFLAAKARFLKSFTFKFVYKYKIAFIRVSRTALIFLLSFSLVFSSLFLGWPLEIQKAQADATSAKSPTVQASDGWTSSDLMEAQDGSSALSPAQNASVNQITFGFTASDIPANSTIDGITVEIDNHKTGTASNRLVINLLNVGTCTAKNLTQDSTDDATYDVLGGAADTWSCTALTQANIVNSAFGVTVNANKVSGPNPAANSWLVDHVKVTVNFTAAAITTTLGSGTDPASTTTAPGTSIGDAGAFTLQTSSGTDTSTAMTVLLAAAGTPYEGISEVRVTSDDGATLYFSAISDPATTTLNFSGGTSIPVSTSSAQFKIRVTPKTHANMPAVSGAGYDLSPRVTAFTSTNSQAGSDSNSNTLTIDNLSPSDVTSTSTSPGDTQVTVSWTNPGGDFSNVVILRATSTISDVPTEGSSPSVNDTIGASTVRYISSGTSTTDTGLTNNTEYFYKIFAKDTNGNYSTPGVQVSATPTAAPTVPTVPQNLSATAGDAVVDLSWNAPASDGGSALTLYSIYRATTTAPTELLATTTAATTTYEDTGVSNGTEYFYRIKATNAVGDSGFSNEDSATPTAAVSEPEQESGGGATAKTSPVPEPPTALTLEGINQIQQDLNSILIQLSAISDTLDEEEIYQIQQDLNAILIQLSAILDTLGDVAPPAEAPPVSTDIPQPTLPEEEVEIILPTLDAPIAEEPPEQEEIVGERKPFFGPVTEFIQEGTKKTVDVVGNAIETTVKQVREIRDAGGNITRTVFRSVTKIAGNAARMTVNAVGESAGKIADYFTDSVVAFNRAAREVGGYIKDTTVAFSGLVRGIASDTGRLIVGVFERPAEPEELSAEKFVFRSGSLELVGDKDTLIQAIVGYRFTTEITPNRPASQITDTFKYIDDDGDGTWSADVELPEVPGEFTLRASIAYADGDSRELETMLLIDPEGYIFEQTSRGELRVQNAGVTLYERVGGEWIVWQSGKYGQENPQVTDRTGQYSFLAPEGEYYIEVLADGYSPFRSSPFTLSTVSPVHETIELIYLGGESF